MIKFFTQEALYPLSRLPRRSGLGSGCGLKNLFKNSPLGDRTEYGVKVRQDVKRALWRDHHRMCVIVSEGLSSLIDLLCSEINRRKQKDSWAKVRYIYQHDVFYRANNDYRIFEVRRWKYLWDDETSKTGATTHEYNCGIRHVTVPIATRILIANVRHIEVSNICVINLVYLKMQVWCLWNRYKATDMLNCSQYGASRLK